MKAFRSLTWLVPAALFACLDGPGLHTTAADDARVIEQITGVWKADDGTELVLCEGTGPVEGGAQGCEAAHVIRSGSASHDEDVVLNRSGCGGLCWEITAFVGGWLRRPGQPDLPVAGRLVTAKSDAQTAYEMPYALHVGRFQKTTATSLDAQMIAPGRLDAAVVKVSTDRASATASSTTSPAFTLKKTAGAAGVCPAPDQSPKHITDFEPRGDAGAFDAARDAREEGATCTHGPPSVECAGTTCSGATPVCCEKNGEVRCVAAACPSFDDGGSAPIGVNEVHCDDARDCDDGEFCCATDDTALSRALSTCSETPCASPLCAADCDCPSGQTCSLGFCH